MQPPAPNSLDTDGITLRRATADDLDRVLAVVHDATRRVQEKGFNMWRLYLTDEGIEQVTRRVNGANGEQVFLAIRGSDGLAVGTFAVEWSDAPIWGDARGNDGRAGYVHMLAVHREARQSALGKRMLKFAERAIAAHGRELLRLDCWRGSEFLRGYYARCGFSIVGEDARQGIYLWEKRVSG